MKPKVATLGLGYIGLPTPALIASHSEAIGAGTVKTVGTNV